MVMIYLLDICLVIAAKNKAMNQSLNQSMPWQRTSGGPGGLKTPRVTQNGPREIHGGPLMQEDKEVKILELAKVNAKNSIFDGILHSSVQCSFVTNFGRSNAPICFGLGV